MHEGKGGGGSPRPRVPASPRRNWVWFFAALVVLAAAAVTLDVWYNLSQQLTPEQLERARESWRQQGPADYDVTWRIARQSRDGDHYLAQVRNGRVAAVAVNGQPLEPPRYPLYDLAPLFDEVERAPADRDREVSWTAPAKTALTVLVHVRGGEVVRVFRNNRPLEPDLCGGYDVPGMFEAVGRQLELDLRPDAGRMFRVATFDPVDGRPLRYVRSVTWPRERVEVAMIQFERPSSP